jgi:hypothetical protein
MMMMFFLPLVVSIIGTVCFVLFTDEAGKWKALAAGLVVASLLMQFYPAWQTHFLVPLAIQVVVSIWMAIYWKR